MTMQQYVHLFDAKEDKTNIHIQRSVSTNPRTDQSTQISLKMMAKAFQSKKILKVLYKHIFRKHFSKQLHHLCRLTVSHLAPPLPPGEKLKKIYVKLSTYSGIKLNKVQTLYNLTDIIYKYMYCSLIIFIKNKCSWIGLFCQYTKIKSLFK